MLINKVLENKYGFDSFNERVFAGGARFIGNKLWQIGDVQLIDGAIVNGTANLIGRISAQSAQFAIWSYLPLRVRHDYWRVFVSHFLYKN